MRTWWGSSRLSSGKLSSLFAWLNLFAIVNSSLYSCKRRDRIKNEFVWHGNWIFDKLKKRRYSTFRRFARKTSKWWFLDSRAEGKRHKEHVGALVVQSTCRATTEQVLRVEELSYDTEIVIILCFSLLKDKKLLGRWNYKSEVMCTGWHTKTDMRHVFR